MLLVQNGLLSELRRASEQVVSDCVCVSVTMTPAGRTVTVAAVRRVCATVSEVAHATLTTVTDVYPPLIADESVLCSHSRCNPKTHTIIAQIHMSPIIICQSL